LPGIDAESGLRRLAGNQKLYQKMLHQFCEEYTDAAAAVKEALYKGNIEYAGQLMHRLKGESGNMGATELYNVTCELESGLHQKGPAIDSLLNKFEKTFNRLLQSVNKLKRIQSSQILSKAKQGGTVNISKAEPLLSKLAALLHENNIEATEYPDILKKHLGSPQFQEMIELLEGHINGLDYEDALKILAEISTSVNVLKKRTDKIRSEK